MGAEAEGTDGVAWAHGARLYTAVAGLSSLHVRAAQLKHVTVHSWIPGTVSSCLHISNLQVVASILTERRLARLAVPSSANKLQMSEFINWLAKLQAASQEAQDGLRKFTEATPARVAHRAAAGDGGGGEGKGAAKKGGKKKKK